MTILPVVIGPKCAYAAMSSGRVSSFSGAMWPFRMPSSPPSRRWDIQHRRRWAMGTGYAQATFSSQDGVQMGQRCLTAPSATPLHQVDRCGIRRFSVSGDMPRKWKRRTNTSRSAPTWAGFSHLSSSTHGEFSEHTCMHICIIYITYIISMHAWKTLMT